LSSKDNNSRRKPMSIKAVLALVSALAATTSTAAFAQHVDPTPYSEQQTYRSVPGGEPKSFGAGHMPRAFYDQEQPGYPQSPPGGGE
jgi:hypothetical protein